jgi:DNA-binding NtrC family response regulator
MASHQHQAAAGQALAKVVGSSTNRSKRASTKRFRDDQWERRIEKDWQGNLETLRQCISELLIGNEHPRMELMKADNRRQE